MRLAIFSLVSLIWSTQLFADIKGLEYGSEYYIRTIANRGYINQTKNGFVISNGLRTRYQFEKAGDSQDEVFINISRTGNYLTAYNDGRVGFENHKESWERYKVVPAATGFSFQTAHGNYLMANFDTGLLSVSPGSVASTWEDFTLEKVYNERGVDENGFNAMGINERTHTSTDERGYNARGFNIFGQPDFDKAAQAHKDNQFLRDQKRNMRFVHAGPKLRARYTPNIYLIIIDTMREDFVNDQTGPNLLKFKNESVHADIALSGSTTTHPSLYSVFHSRPSYELFAYAASGAGMGPLPLNILKYKLGYTIKATGKRDMGCLDIAPPAPYFPISQLSYLAAMEFRFGLKTYLLDDCVVSGSIGNETLYKDHLINLDKNVFDHFISIAAQSRREKTIIIAHLEGAHTPYLFEANDLQAAHGYQFESQKNYAMAFHKTDRWFGKFISQLKRRHLYDDALIVVLGDHGEELPGPPAQSGDHGSYPVDVMQTRVPLYFKFPKNALRNVPVAKVITLADVFPTIFDYFGIWGGLDYFFTGRPITDLRTHVIPVSRVNPDNEMAFFAYPYKLNVRYRPQDYVGPQSMAGLENIGANDFELGDLEDFNDRTINPAHKIEIDSKYLANFKDIFPSLISGVKSYYHEDVCPEPAGGVNDYPINARLDFVVRNQGLCLTSTSKNDGGLLTFAECNDDAHEQRFERVLLANGQAQIRSQSSCKCVDIQWQAIKPSAVLHQWTCHPGTSQHFEFLSNDNTTLHDIKSSHSKLCVENSKHGLIQNTCAKDNPSQQFQIDYLGKGNFR